MSLELSDKELLNLAANSGMLDIASIRRLYEMRNRQEVLNKHEYKIWCGADGLWRTYLPDNAKGRILKKRKSKVDIENAVVEYYRELEDVKTFGTCFRELQEAKREVVSPNTYDRYSEDYVRFFQNTDIDERRIENFDSELLDIFIKRRIKQLNLRKKAMKAMYGYIKAVFMHACIKKYIRENPALLLNNMNYYSQHCYTPVMDSSKRIVSQEQSRQLQARIQMDHEEKPDYIPTYAVELAMLTGMRVGEIAALRWDAVTTDFILVDKEEVYNRQTKTYTVTSYTKNRRPRIIPVTEQITELLERLRAVQEDYGFAGEWLFMNEKGRVHKNAISNCARYKSYQCGMDSKPIHAHRRTLNSVMRCSGISATVTSAILGNTEAVNENYYTYDMTDIREKRDILAKAQKVIKGNQAKLIGIQ